MSTAFPKDKRSHVWEAVKTIVRRSPRLSAVKTRLMWEGTNRDVSGPTPDACPWMRVTPIGGPLTVFSEVWMNTPLEIRVEIAVDGTDAADLMDFWGAVELAFGRLEPSPDETTDVFAYLRNASENPNQGVISYQFVRGDFRILVPSPNETPMIRGEGRIQFLLSKPI